MEWKEVQEGVWLDDGQRWSIRLRTLPGFDPFFRLMDVRTHEIEGIHNTLRDAQKHAEEVGREQAD